MIFWQKNKLKLQLYQKLKSLKETNNFIQVYSGVNANDRAHSGVMLMIHKSLKSNIDSYSYWSDTIIQERLKLSRGYLTVFCIYALTEGKEEESETFYNTLQQIWNKTNESHMVTIMWDFNARVSNTKIHNNIGHHGENTCNRNGKKTDNFVVFNNMKIMNTFFQHKKGHKYT
jgi:hypothetical protein